MSLDFFPMTFPALPATPEQDRADADNRAAGHAAGYAAGLRAAGAELAGQRAALDAEHRAALLHDAARTDRAIAVLAAAARALDSRLLPIVTDAQDAIAASALDLAETIIGVELADGEGSARAALTRALAVVDPAVITTVRMNPLDLGVLDDAVRAASGVSFTADASIARGDAIADLPLGYLDARIATAVARARAAMLGDTS
ncbi:FliH/SctL family protein [Frigoribacterium sp. UYMn621]|jgi:flagellar assembly protein FliH|uniref:FliH/SctL family protein n=1 Tax=Frigoribacterium sp. UYMn621 TaxID=3156343 RepID=UPI0033919C22